MKKTIRSLSGIMLVLLCVLQLALIAPASAEEAAQADAKAEISYTLFIKGEDRKYAAVTDTEAAPIKDSGFAVELGAGGGTLEALRKNGVVITPPKGYGISSLFCVGTDGRLDAGAKSLTLLSECTDITTGRLKLSGGLFEAKTDSTAGETDETVIEAEKTVGSVINGVAGEKKRVEDTNAARELENKEKKNKEDIKKETEHYFIHIYLDRTDENAAVQLTYTSGEAILINNNSVLVEGGNSFTAISPEVKEGEEKKNPEHTVLPLIPERGDKAVKGQGLEFDTWRLVFPNGSGCDVKAGDVIAPYTSCKLEAQWKHVISIVFEVKEKTYDATPLTGSIDSVAGLKQWEHLTLDEGVLSASLTDVGQTEYSISTDDIAAGKLHILNIANEEVTENYIDPEDLSNIRLFPGTLTVSQRPLTVSVKYASQDYNGTALTAAESTVTGLVEGHTAAMSYTGSQTVPGVSDSGAENVKVMSGEADVTANYSVTVNGGKLTVNALEGENRRSISVKPADGQKVYDGSSLIPSAYTIVSGELLEGESLKLSYGGEQLGAGTSASTITSCAVMNGETDVSENYVISLSEGSLTVNPYPLSLTAGSEKKVVDGSPLTCEKYTVSSGALISGHKISSVKFSGSQTDVGSSANVIVPDSVIICDSENNNVTSCYAITLVPGTLTVADKPISEITLTVGNYTKVYDGQSVRLTANDVKVTSGTIPAGYTLEPTFSATSLVNVGKETVNIINIVIKDANGVDATSRFSITREPGTVEITPRTLTIQTKSATKAYDGKPLTEKSTPTVTGRLEGQQISLRITGTQTKVGSSSNTVSDVAVTVKDTKEDVTGNYTVVIKAGTLTVTEATGGSTSEKPGTGDSSRLGILVGLIVFALAGIVVVVIIITRRSREI